MPHIFNFFLQIYNSLIGSVLQYASCVWQIGNKDNLDKLNGVLRALGHQGHGRHGRLLCSQTWVKGYMT
jgi:hypothetical protein